MSRSKLAEADRAALPMFVRFAREDLHHHGVGGDLWVVWAAYRKAARRDLRTGDIAAWKKSDPLGFDRGSVS